MSIENKSLLVANWKMNLDGKSSAELARSISKVALQAQRTAIWLAPSFTSIASTLQATSGSPIHVGAQNVHWSSSGAYTGEVSPPMLSELGVKFVIVGHSERRHIFHETDSMVSDRASAALQAGFSLIYCVGETLQQFEHNETDGVLARQILSLLSVTKEANLPISNTIIAYEPVWAIGTGKVANLSQIEAAHKLIKEIWSENINLTCPRVIYGGSVAPDNFSEIISLDDVDGALVGGASLSYEKFSQLIDISERRETKN